MGNQGVVSAWKSGAVDGAAQGVGERAVGGVMRAVALLGLLGGVGLSGCGGSFANLPPVNLNEAGQSIPIGNLQGSVYGGQQPIWQGQVYLMKASTAGYGTKSVSVMTAGANTTLDSTSALKNMGPGGTGTYYVTTDMAGNFNITGDYTCNYNATTPSQSDQLYLVALNGNATFVPGNPPTGGSMNPYIGEMAVLGQCPSNGTFAGHLNFINMNEVSTVAAAYALAGFASNSYSVGSSGTALAQVGLANAMANANQLADIQGSVPFGEARSVTPGGNGRVPNLLINTLANILASCINESNATAYPPTTPSCQTLYQKTGSGTADTASAMIHIAQNPGSNVSALYGIPSGNLQFIDGLPSAPADFTVGIQYTQVASPANPANPVDVAVDASGNAWVTSANGNVSELTPLGAQATGSPYSVPSAGYVAIDSGGNAWVTGSSEVFELTGSGGAVTGPTYTVSSATISGGGLSAGLSGIAVDATGTYVANPNLGFNLLGLTSAGNVVQITGTSSSPKFAAYYNGVTNLLGITVLSGIPNVSQVANGPTGSLWISGDGLNCVLGLGVLCGGLNAQKLSETSTNFPGTALFSTPVASTSSWPAAGVPYSCLLVVACGAIEQPEGLAVDNGGSAWVAVEAQTSAATNTTGVDELARVSSAGAVTGRYTGGGLSKPFEVAIDGSGEAFVTNSGTGSVSAFSSAGGALSGSGGYGSTAVAAPTTLDLDESGDAWVVSPGVGGYVTELIGIATPVVRPLSAAVAAGKLGATP